MSMSISRSLLVRSALACVAVFLSACSENDPANVPFSDIDRSELPTNTVPNQDLGASSSEWTGWSTSLDESNGASATFTMASFPISQGGNTIEASVGNVEANSLPGDISAGPVSVPVEPGKSYGVAVYAAGARCGAVNVAAHPTGDPGTILAEQQFFLNGQPQGFDYYFEVPEGVTSVDLPVRMAMADNMGERVYVDRVTAIPRPMPNGGAEGSILENGSFELSEDEINIEVNGAATWGQAGSNATFTLVDGDVSEPQDGEKFVQIEFNDAAGTGDPWLIEAGPVGIPAQAGFTYTAAVWIKGTEGARANFIVQNSNNYNVYASQEVTVTSEWQEVRFDATVTDDAVVRLYAQFNFTENANKTIYVDNYKFIPPDTCPYQPIKNNKVSENSDLFAFEHVTNGSFEASDTDFPGWAFQASGAASASYDVQVTDPEANINRSLVYDADNSVKITINTLGENPSDIQATPTDLYVVPGQTYSYSGYARGATGSVANFVAASVDGVTVYEEQQVVFDNIWQQVTFDFTVPENATVLTSEELADAGLPEDAVLSALHMGVWLSYPENDGRRFLLDHFSLLPNAAVNGDLENSDETAEGWSWQAPEDVATFALDSTVGQAHTGSNSLRIDIADLQAEGLNLWDVEAGMAEIPVTGGRTYYVSARIKGEEGARAKILLGMAEEPYEEFASESGEDGDDADTAPDGIEVGPDWQEVTFAAVVPSGVDTVRLVAQLGYPDNSRKTIYLDSFRVVSEIPPDPADEGWTTQVPTGSGAELDNADVIDGTYSLRMDIGDLNAAELNLADIQASATDFPVDAEGEYDVSAYIKGEAGTMATFVLESADGLSTYIGSVDDIVLTGDWQQITFQVTAPVDVTTVRLIAQLGYIENANTSIYLDAFSVEEVSGIITANMVTNGGLEFGNTTGWNANGATIAVTNSQEGIYSGNFGLDVYDRTAEWNSAQYSLFDSDLEVGGRYLVSSMVKVKGDVTDTLGLTLLIRYSDGTADQYVGISSTGDADTLSWTNLSGAFDFNPTGEVSGVWVYIESAGADTSYYIDDLFVTREHSANGNLERGDTSGWNGAGAQIDVTDAEPFDGTYSLHVTGRTEAWNSAQYELINTGVQAGRTYQISAWVKVDGDVADNIKMTVEVQDEDNETNRYVGLDQSAETLDWVMLSRTYTFAPDGEATSFKVYFEADTATSSYFIDNLFITEVVPPVNIASNGDIEFGRTDGWENSGDAVIAVTQSAEGVNSGIYGLDVSGRTQNWHSAQYVLTDAELAEGATYMASAWVKVNGDTADNLKLTFYFNDGGDNYLSVGQTGEADTLGWTKIEGTFNYAPTAEVTRSHIYIEADGADTAYFVDDLVIKRVYSVNGGLEASDTEPTGWNAAGATIAVTADDAHSGNNSLLVSDRSQGWHSAQYNLLNSGMEAGKTYDISAWVKIVGDTADNIKMTIEVQDEDNDANQYLGVAQSSDTLTWVKLSSRYTYSPDGEATVFRVYFEADLETSAYYIDDLVIKEADEVNPF